MSKVLAIFRRSHPHMNALSAHLDARLDPAGAASLEAHLASCNACARRLDELQAARLAVQDLPALDVPHSFRLRRSDIEAPAPAPAYAWATGVLRLMPAMSVIAVVLFVVLIGSEAIWRADDGSGAASTRALDAPAAAEQARSANSGAKAPTNEADSQANRIAPSSAGAPAVPTECPTCAAFMAAPSPTPPAPAADALTQDFAPAPPSSPETGTSGAATTSETPTAPAKSLIGESQPTAGAQSNNSAPASSSRDRNDRLALHIAEAILAAVAIGAGAIAGVRWMSKQGGVT